MILKGQKGEQNLDTALIAWSIKSGPCQNQFVNIMQNPIRTLRFPYARIAHNVSIFSIRTTKETNLLLDPSLSPNYDN